RGYALTERLCVYPQYMNREWLEGPVLEVLAERFPTFLPRRGDNGSAVTGVAAKGTGAAGAPFAGPADLTARAAARGREGEELSAEELVALFSERRPEAIEEIRQAADELRADLAGETATFVV